MKPFWTPIVNSNKLAQGDWLTGCFIPVFAPEFGCNRDGKPYDVPVKEANLIITTQSCDLENNKVELVALCPIYTVTEFRDSNPSFNNQKLEEVRKGRIAGLHLLASPVSPENNQSALIVDFGQIFSLPVGYLTKRAEELGSRWRLESPFLEHFSQAFARYFMRVGLPSSIPPFK